MINRVVLVGRITKDPELRKTQSGISTVSFTVACNRRFQSAGEGQPQADFINCVTWRQSADFLANYVKKGALLGVEGRIQTRSYDDNSGRKVYVTEVLAENVQILESKKDQASSNQAYVPSSQPEPAMYEADDFSADTLDIASDDLPF